MEHPCAEAVLDATPLEAASLAVRQQSDRALRPAINTLAGLMALAGFMDAINGAAAPLFAREFGLDDAGIARAFGWMSLGAFATFPLARAADRFGRRRVARWCLVSLAPLALAGGAAPGLWLFVGAQLLIQGFKGALMNVVPVMVAEALPTERRSGGQGLIGAVGAIGSGAALIAVSLSGGLPGGWRWVWCAAVPIALALLWPLGRNVTESGHFERAAATGETNRSRTRELFAPSYRRRTLGVLAVSSFLPMAVAGTQAWLIYHPVANLGIEQGVATMMVIAGGAVGMLGFPLGGWMSNRWGRRPAFATAGIAYTVSGVCFYSVTPDFAYTPAVGLGLSFALMAAATSASSVALRAAATELFPTRLRGTILGASAVATAAAIVAVNFGVARLSELLGGLAPAASIAAFAMLAAVAAFLTLPETAGLDLEQASLEDDIGHQPIGAC